MKKKGLIISTVVMVMVLVAALSTATFAWFSTSARAEIKDISVTTSAAEGLEIALQKGEEFFNGDIAVDETGKWTGAPGYGNIINLTGSFGGIASASTYTDATTWYGFKVITTDTVPTVAVKGSLKQDGSTPVTLTNGAGLTAAVGTTVYVQYPARTMITATDFQTGTTIPTAFRPSIENKDYLYMPIRLHTTVADVTHIMYKVTITPEKGTATPIKDSMMPGMLAASKINYSKIAAGTAGELAHEPFGAWTVSGQTMKNGTLTYATATEKSYVHYGFLNNETTSTLPAYQDITLDITSWIEGLDTECINGCAGSGYKISIEFAFDKETTALTIDGLAQSTTLWAAKSAMAETLGGTK